MAADKHQDDSPALLAVSAEYLQPKRAKQSKSLLKGQFNVFLHKQVYLLDGTELFLYEQWAAGVTVNR